MPSESFDIQIRPGMSESTDPRLLPMGGNGSPAVPRLIQNYRFRQLGRAEKRPGALTLGTTGLPTAGSACWVGEANGTTVAGILETETTGREDTGVYVNNGGSRWSYLGRHGACVPLRRFGVAGRENTATYKSEGVVAANGLLYVVYADESASPDRVYVIEYTPEGTALRTSDPTSVSGYSPRLVWTGAAMYLVTNDAGTVKIRELDLTTFALGSPTSVVTSAASSLTLVDVANLEGSAGWMVCYAANATTLHVRLFNGTSSVASANITTTDPPLYYSVAGQVNENIVVLYADDDEAHAAIYTGLLAATGSVLLHTLTGNEGWLTQFVMASTDDEEYAVLLGGLEDSSSAPDLATGFTRHIILDTSSTGSASSQQKIWHFVPGAKPIRIGADGDAQVYCWMHNGAGDWGGTGQSRHLLALVETSGLGFGAQLAGLSYEHEAHDESGVERCGSFADLGDGRFAVLANWLDQGKFAGIDCAVFSLAGPSVSVAKAHRLVEQAGGALFISGGILSDVPEAPVDFTGVIPENGFAHAPLVRLELAAGAGLVANAEVTYVALFRRIDGLGRVSRSAVSKPVSITPTGGNLRVTVYVTTLGFSNRFLAPGEKVVAEVYRSENGGAFYYVQSTTSVEPTPSVVSFTDANAPDDIVDDDGAIDIEASQPTAPSGARLIRAWGERFAVVGWKERAVQLSKTFRDDTPWEFVNSDAFRVQAKYPITALGWMDGAGVIFTATRIYIVTGDGPQDNGGGFFDPARELPATVGADSPHVVEVPQGLLFKGAGTIWLLPRGFGPPQPVGDDIQETLASYPYLRAAVRCSNADDDVTHFVLASSDLPAATTKVAIWDNRLGMWSLDDIDGEAGAAGSVNGVFTWLLPTWDSANDVPARKFSTASTQDLTANGAASWIESRITFGDWRPGGIVGWGNLEKVQFLGEIAGSCTLSLTVSTDANSPDAMTKVMASTGQFYLEHGLKYPKGCAFNVSIFDAENSGKTAGLVLHALAVEFNKTPGLRRVAEGTAERIS